MHRSQKGLSRLSLCGANVDTVCCKRFARFVWPVSYDGARLMYDQTLIPIPNVSTGSVYMFAPCRQFQHEETVSSPCTNMSVFIHPRLLTHRLPCSLTRCSIAHTATSTINQSKTLTHCGPVHDVSPCTSPEKQLCCSCNSPRIILCVDWFTVH